MNENSGSSARGISSGSLRPPISARGRRNALLDTQNILLGAHALGLGSCLIRCALATMRKDCRIREALNIPREENVHSVVALGHPAVTGRRLAGRRRREVRIVEFRWVGDPAQQFSDDV